MKTFGDGNLALSNGVRADGGDGEHQTVQYCAAHAYFS
jgi:hypothetical protein